MSRHTVDEALGGAHVCTLPYGHDGPCNGYPGDHCRIHRSAVLPERLKDIVPVNCTNKTLSEMTDAERKALPVFTGVMEYFPDALLEVSAVSKAGNDQHNPGQPLHWAREKSQDQLNTAIRHAMQHGTRDSDGRRHMAKACWRFLAELQLEIEAERAGMSRADYDAHLREAAEDTTK